MEKIKKLIRGEENGFSNGEKKKNHPSTVFFLFLIGRIDFHYICLAGCRIDAVLESPSV